jgi:hypothetical protein
MNESKLKNDVVKMWGLIAFAASIIYYMPSIFNYAFFLTVIVVMLVLKKYNYFWVAFWFVLLDCPGSLFESGGNIGFKQFPFLSIFGGVISLKSLIPLVFLLMAFPFRKSRKLVLRKDYFFLLSMFIGFFALGLIYGMSVNSIFNTFLILISWSLLFSLPRLLSYSAIINLDRLLFTVVFVAFISQIFTITTGIIWVNMVNERIVNSMDIGTTEFNVSRYLSGAYIILYCLIKALYYSFGKNNPFSTRYTNLIIIISLFSIFLSGTRGWILASIILMLLIIFSQIQITGKIKKLLPFTVIGGLVIFGAISFLPIIKTQMGHVGERFLTVEQLVQGDLSMGGSLTRVTDRAPRVLAAFYDKMILGEGFSNVYWSKRDRHVGHLVVLLNCGIVGYIIFTFFFIKWLYLIYSLPKNDIGVKTLYGFSPKIISFGFIFIYVIHSTSHMYWGFDLKIGPILTIVLFLATFNEIRLNGLVENYRLSLIIPNKELE